MNTHYIEVGQLLLSLGATLLVTCVWYGIGQQAQHKETIACLDEQLPDASNNVDLGLKGSKDWAVVILLLCLMAHSYSEVFEKRQDEPLAHDALAQPELVFPDPSPRPAVLLTTDLSINGCRKILEQNGLKYSDEQILRIKKRLYNLCLLDYELFLKMKTSKT